ncbi:restriction endonuclease subunit S [Elizabethkingia anophelis]|uniref:restriction endonuclease subunit S n=1 Tax=Elizabethkingia anophelis TaxID=1117645 RepID=UPI00136E228F|nr:restriction endonuclease subunit S [Elizabethkingia anophelis]MCT4296112.1 restriction endonuclease subunit S [Elizabethkingia anophelis]MYZ60914.1 restriction endonuclease subunit S [Elizabethkingia anophelis]
MTEENKNVKKFPNLRFPGFEGEWEVKILSDLGTFSGGGTPTSSNEKFWNGNIPWISSSDLQEDNIFKINISRFITQDAIEKSSTKLCKAPSVLIVSRVGVGKVALSLNDVCTSQDFTNISELKCNQLYLAFQLSKVMKKAANEVQGTSIKGISSSEIKSKKIYLPPIIEQEKISSFIEKIDKRIQTQRKIIEQLETLMRANREKLFSQKLRFKDEQANYFSDWNLTELKNVCFIIGGGTPDTQKPEFWNGNIQWFTPTEIKSNFAFKSERTITELGLKNSSAKILPKGSILLTTRATIGEVAIAQEECTTNQGFQSLIVKENCNNVFLFYWIKENKFELIRRANGSTFPEISKSEIELIKISLPPLEEQTKIANFLFSIQEKIETEKQILEKLELQKKFLLANLFV